MGESQILKQWRPPDDHHHDHHDNLDDHDFKVVMLSPMLNSVSNTYSEKEGTESRFIIANTLKILVNPKLVIL